MLKRFFRKSRNAPAPATEQRNALASINAKIVQAEQDVTRAQDRIDRLKRLVADEVTANQNLQTAIASDAGESLESFAAGETSAIDLLVKSNDAASKAAVLASAALPEAERDLARAVDAVAGFERQKRILVGAALLQYGDVLAAKYVAAFAELGALHDELRAFANGLVQAGFPDVAMAATGELEAPKFDLPAMKPQSKNLPAVGFSRHGLASDTGGYDPYLRHKSDGFKVQDVATRWKLFAQRLEEDPSVDVLSLPAPPPSTARSDLVIQRRERKEPDLIDAGLLPGHPAGRYINL